MAFARDETVHVERARERQTGREQNGGPDGGVVAQNILANNLNVGGPIFLEGVTVGVAERGNVVGEGIEPHVHDLVRIARNRHAPVELLHIAADADVFETAFEQRHNFVLANLGLDSEFVGRNKMLDLIGVSGKFEEIIVFLDLLERGFMDGTDVIWNLKIGVEGLATHAIPTFVAGFVDVFGAGSPEGLGGFFVARVGGADKLIV